ncbi:MAG: HAD family phosphatase [Lachnospiraceae bacterium]|nr:HAD family phosphatase [Lachnospiraceae bacterium]
MIKNIVFDVGMVLVDFKWREVMADVGCTPEETEAIAKVMVNGTLWNELDRGVMDEEDVIAKMLLELPGYENKARAFWNNIHHTIESFPYAKDWIKGLEEEGYHTYLLTNYPRSLYQNTARQYFTFLPYVEGVLVSSHEKLIKPDEAIYKRLLEKFNLQAEETIFIDDRLVNIEGAARVGIKGIHFTNFEEVNSKLRDIIKANQ